MIGFAGDPGMTLTCDLRFRNGLSANRKTDRLWGHKQGMTLLPSCPGGGRSWRRAADPVSHPEEKARGEADRGGPGPRMPWGKDLSTFLVGCCTKWGV